MTIRVTSVDDTVEFDEVPPEPALWIAPKAPVVRNDSSGLWWSLPGPPEMIDELVEAVADAGSVPEAIVIAGLERYPVSSDEWPRWLVRWGRRDGTPRIIVRTQGLAEGDRRRLVRRTRRQATLRREVNPVVELTEAIADWFVGRRR